MQMKKDRKENTKAETHAMRIAMSPVSIVMESNTGKLPKEIAIRNIHAVIQPWCEQPIGGNTSASNPTNLIVKVQRRRLFQGPEVNGINSVGRRGNNLYRTKSSAQVMWRRKNKKSH